MNDKNPYDLTVLKAIVNGLNLLTWALAGLFLPMMVLGIVSEAVGSFGESNCSSPGPFAFWLTGLIGLQFALGVRYGLAVFGRKHID